jgi:hypothetical protein
MNTLLRNAIVVSAALGLGACGQPQAAEDPVAALREDVVRMQARIDALEAEQATIKKEAQACRTELDLALASNDELGGDDDEPTSRKSSSSSSGSRRSGSSGGGSKSGDVRMPGDG